MGWGDYVTKPFSVEEPIASVRVVLMGRGDAGASSQSRPLAGPELKNDAHKSGAEVR